MKMSKERGIEIGLSWSGEALPARTEKYQIQKENRKWRNEIEKGSKLSFTNICKFQREGEENTSKFGTLSRN